MLVKILENELYNARNGKYEEWYLPIDSLIFSPATFHNIRDSIYMSCTLHCQWEVATMATVRRTAWSAAVSQNLRNPPPREHDRHSNLPPKLYPHFCLVSKLHTRVVVSLT